MTKRYGRSLCLCAFSTLLAAAPEGRRTPQAGTESTQYFARGFELDLGTDFCLDLGGIPLNTPSHIHGPGFLNTALLVPELVAGCTYTKGLYQPGQGAFAVAGSSSLELVSSLPQPFLALTYGGAATDRLGRLLWADHLPGPGLTCALDISRNDRPWNDLFGSARFNAAFRKDGEGRRGRWTFTALGSEEKSDGGAAKPLRPVDDEVLDNARAGDGTWNQRLLMGWRLTRQEAPGRTTRLRLYAGAHHERTWNNWTFFLRDPQRGDQLEQVDRRAFLGADCAREWVVGRGALAWTHTLGLQTRYDRVTAAESAPSVDRKRVAGSPVPAYGARADLLHGALYGQSAARWTQGWEAFLGLRLDAQVNNVHTVTGPWQPQARSQVLGSPRAGLSFSPAEGTLFSLQAGQGFRLGDAYRETQPMVRARSVEWTAQTRPWQPWTTSLTLWRLDLESESLFDPLQNAFTARGPARHEGVEVYNEFRRVPWQCDLVLGWNRAAFKGRPSGLDHVPGSVPMTGTLGMAWSERGFSLGARFRRTGVRPLTLDGSQTADRQDGLELRVQKDGRNWSLAVELLNVFSLKKYNHEYYYASAFPGESPTAARHIRGADPQTLRLELRRRF